MRKDFGRLVRRRRIDEQPDASFEVPGCALSWFGVIPGSFLRWGRKGFQKLGRFCRDEWLEEDTADSESLDGYRMDLSAL